MRRLLLGVLCVLVLPIQVGADAFDSARRALNINVGRFDTSGSSIHGGVGLRSGTQPGTVTLFRGQGTAGGTGCGAADFAESMKEAFESIPAIVSNVGSSLVQNMPLLVLCYGAPSLCDLAKHWQALVNTLIQFKYARCEQVQTAMAYLGSRLAGGDQGKCLDYQVNTLKYPLGTAMDNCLSTVSFLTAPDGSHVMNYSLIEDSLRYAGAAPETIQVARSLLGEVRMSAEGGRYGVNHQHAPSAVFNRYEAHRIEMDVAVQQALRELRETGQVSDTAYQAITVPGQVIPRATLDGLNAMRSDPVTQQALTDKLSTSLAITRLTWECTQLQEELSAAMDANSQMGDGERKILQQKLDTFRQDLQRVYDRVRPVTEHLQPAIEAIDQQYARMQQQAVQAGFRAPSSANMRFPFGTQGPGGYGQ